MVTKYGMSDRVGTMMLGSENQEVFLGRDFGREKNYSEETAAIIDEEVKKIIDRAYATAKEILNQNRDKLDKIAAILIEREKISIAAILIEREKISGEEFDRIFNGEE